MKNLFNQAIAKLGGSGGGEAGLVQAIIAMISREGGLGGLIKLFQDKGLGDVVASWTGTGANLPITPEQLGDVLGPERVERLAEEAKLPADRVTSGLASMLPKMMDSLTPDGVLPDGEGMRDRLSALAGKLL